jgi:hypothetical protein
MSELKSAWEIAQEKAGRLGKLSAEEEQQNREENCRQIARGLVQRYMDSPQKENLASELKAHSGEEKKLIRKAILSELIGAMELGNPQKLDAVSRGIASLAPESQPALEQLSQLAQEYERASINAKHGLENEGREMLHRLRISGTAVSHINIETTARWQQNEQSLKATFAPRLDNLKRELQSLVHTS